MYTMPSWAMIIQKGCGESQVYTMYLDLGSQKLEPLGAPDNYQLPIHRIDSVGYFRVGDFRSVCKPKTS